MFRLATLSVAPLLKPGVGTGPEDYTKRSKNRYDSDFIWNTNWMEKVISPELIRIMLGSVIISVQFV